MKHVVTVISFVVGMLLLIGTILWSTDRLPLPGPFARLRLVPKTGPGGQPDLSTKARQDRARAFRDRLLASIYRDRLVTITVHVALCDSRKSEVANPALGRGNSPFDNLYWGARYGVEGFFQRQSEWKVIHADSGAAARYVLRRVIFTRRVEPTSEWRQRGVTEPFDICMLAIAWSGPAAADAMRATLSDALGLEPPRVIPVGGRRIRFGSDGNFVGYVGYNAVRDDPSVLPDPAELLPGAGPQGVFFISPASAESVGAALLRLGIYPILLTTDRSVVPEAYILYGITEALALGQIERGFSEQAAAQYAHFRRIDPEAARKLFLP
ncbi:MAG: hypothetical protein JXQ73_05150 [Phycisphaerae bacterium]|nr:hypothetical protein [Phycisphaerae bacterium]